MREPPHKRVRRRPRRPTLRGVLKAVKAAGETVKSAIVEPDKITLILRGESAADTTDE